MWLAAAIACALLAVPYVATGQTPDRIARIALLRSESRPLDDRLRQNFAALRAGLKDGGYVEGQHYRLDYYSPKSAAEAIRLARALARDHVDVIHASAFIAIDAARKATASIPIVAHDYETDPIAAGLVASLARPGGNVTGMFMDLPEMAGKLLELLKTAVPSVRRIGVVWDPLTGTAQVSALEQAAKALELDAVVLEARAGRLEQAVRAAADRKASALVLLGSPVLSAGFSGLAEAATAARLPSIALLPAFARSGGLMAYGPDAPDQYRQEGRMIAKILAGAKPADLPVERPTKFYFLVNLKTARALGLALSPALLPQADEIID